MAAILQMTFSNAFSWIKFTVFYSYFIKTYSQGSNYEYAIIGSDDGLTPCRGGGGGGGGGGLKFSPVNKIYILQCMGKLFCVESKVPFEIPHKISYLYIARYVFMQHWNFKSS